MNTLLNTNLLKLINSYNRQIVNKVLVSNDIPLRASVVPHWGNWSQNSVRFAGHSKWQNIKHTKLSKDQEKGRKINIMLNRLKVALRSSGGADPKLNRDFADVMEMCRRANIPSATTDRAIKRFLEKKCTPIKMEIMGPNGSLFVLDGESESKATLRYAVRGVLKKYKQFAFVEDGRAMYAFEEKGVVRVKDKDKNGQQIDLEKAEEIAIEADAEEVKASPDDESILLFITDSMNWHKTRKYIEENTDFEVIDNAIELLPFTRVELPEDTLQVVANAINELEDLEEINRVFNNLS